MSKPMIVVIQNPDWLADIQARLDETYAIQVLTQREGYVTWLADHLVALILVDLDQPDWHYWTATTKSSSATRRIPIIAVSEQADQRREALLSGADIALTAAELREQISQLVADYARVMDSATQDELDCQCAEDLPPLAIEGFEKFNAGEYYPQHDLFEAQWVKTSGPVRDLYRAILQVGVAYYQIERGNHRGALKMLLRSVQWLSILPDVCQGVDVAQLRTDSYRVRAELESMKPEDIAQFDRSLLKGLKRVE